MPGINDFLRGRQRPAETPPIRPLLALDRRPLPKTVLFSDGVTAQEGPQPKKRGVIVTETREPMGDPRPVITADIPPFPKMTVNDEGGREMDFRGVQRMRQPVITTTTGPMSPPSAVLTTDKRPLPIGRVYDDGTVEMEARGTTGPAYTPGRDPEMDARIQAFYEAEMSKRPKKSSGGMLLKPQ
jgi:hypothetical protein